jgi:hypothetical protein
MGEELTELISAVEGEVRLTTLADDSKHTAVWCVQQLPGLYDKFRRTCESRYGEEITRLVRAALQALADGNGNSPVSRELAAGIPGRLNLLHEQFGIPPLKLSPPVPTPRRSRKPSSAAKKPSGSR